jgi:hypothetical protein
MIKVKTLDVNTKVRKRLDIRGSHIKTAPMVVPHRIERKNNLLNINFILAKPGLNTKVFYLRYSFRLVQKQTLLLSILLFTIGFMLMNGTNNFIAVLFMLLLLYVFILVPLFYRIKFLVKELSNTFTIHKQWA